MKAFYDLVYDPQHPDACVMDLFLPKGRGPFPLFLYFHGGGLEGGSRKDEATVLGLVERGIAVASADYRLYPQAKFPDFLEDAAAAAGWLKANANAFGTFDRIAMGGSSAGAYLSMMLFFDGRYLEKQGLHPADFSAFVFNAGQPTTHFNVLRERGLDPRAVRVDEAAPLFFVDHTFQEPDKLPRILVLFSDQDMPGREEQNRLLMATMLHFGYPAKRLELEYVRGFPHCGYSSQAFYLDRVADFIKGQ